MTPRDDAPAPHLSRRALFAHARHELRTPLNAIIGYSELLLEDLEDAGEDVGTVLVPDLERVHRCGRDLLGLVDTLFDSEKLARTPDLSLDEYPARISHVLRVPLTSAIGYCELLLEDAADEPESVRAEIAKILKAGNRLLAVTNEIIAMIEAAVTTPLPTEAAVTPSTAMRPDAEPAPPRVDSRSDDTATRGRLLVVDDVETNRDLLSRRLKRYGHTVATARHGREALEKVRVEEFDIVLLDVIMPEMDGYATLQRFKADPALRDLSVIMISALDEMDSVARCIELGAEDYLPKTFDPILLQARIGACLEKKAFRDREKLYLQQIESEKRRADDLLRVILPEPIIHELHTTNRVVPRLYEDVAVLFCDVVNFTPYCAERDPGEVIANLQEMIERYEQIALQHGVQKIKTIGDSFMGTAGLIEAVTDPVRSCVECGLAMVEEARKLASGWEVRVGIHAGPVVAGVIGRRQYQFDLWGDTVNMAQRVESHGTNGAVNVSATTWHRIAPRYLGASTGTRELKGKGSVEIYRISGRR